MDIYNQTRVPPRLVDTWVYLASMEDAPAAKTRALRCIGQTFGDLSKAEAYLHTRALFSEHEVLTAVV